MTLLTKTRSISIPTLTLSASAICIATFVTCYAISMANGDMEYPYYFLSSSLDFSPASCFGSFGLSPVSFLLPIIGWVRYEQVREVTKSIINRIMVMSSFVSAIGAHGVASFQAHNWMTVHLFFAFLFFGGGSLVVVCAVTTDYYCSSFGTALMRNYRRFAAAVVGCCLTALCTLAVLFIPPGGECDKTCQKFQFINAILEITVMVLMLSFYVSFIPEFQGWKFKVIIEREGGGGVGMGVGGLTEPLKNTV
ncbi:hypothetical protein TrLO_g12328 [Triparma laevis f. longispina]|uniref:CWH43-like N-terminal domain-containing protein n=1 Tax=Triparma laevis f. longispina TaxID=1714387 RepID=A0A9W7KXA7_9STRA|nr:hypothetical protein TrLO_g12328 [Triparma laevis f. longispina]